MGFGNIVVFSQVVLFFLVFVLSFFIFIPLSVNVGDFSDHCLLFADGDWTRNQSDFLITAQLVNVKWGPGASCNYPIFIGVLNMIIAIIYVVRESKHLFTRTDSSWLDAFGTCLLCFVVMVMGFAAALTVNSGFQAWCKLLLKPGSEINSCENGEYMSFGTKLGIKTDRYFLHLQLTQFGVWSSWFCWVVLSSLTIIKIYRYSRQEAFLTSMNRERERLVQRLGPQQQEI